MNKKLDEFIKRIQKEAELTMHEWAYLDTYHAIKKARDAGINAEQITRIVANLYHVYLPNNPMPKPNVFYLIDNEELKRELEKITEITDKKELSEQQCEQDHIEDILRS